MEDTLRTLFTLDEGEGHAVQIVIWSYKNMDRWDDEFVINLKDLEEDETGRAKTRAFVKFLDYYKNKKPTLKKSKSPVLVKRIAKKPSIGKVVKKVASSHKKKSNTKEKRVSLKK